MNTAEMLEKIAESLGSKATVKSVYGEPIHAEGKTVVPIAKVAYGFGAGSGTGRSKNAGDPERNGEGGGGGGGVRAYPAGVLEITADRTRFIPYIDNRALAAVFSAGLLLGSLIAARRRS